MFDSDLSMNVDSIEIPTASRPIARVANYFL